MNEGGAPTLLTAASDARREATFRHRLRTSAYRIVADCERMLESFNDGSHAPWRDAIGEALLCGRQLMALPAGGAERGGEGGERQVTQRIAAIGARIQEPRERIINAMNAVLRFVPVTPDEELLLQDARMVRETATNLLGQKPASHGLRAAANAAGTGSGIERRATKRHKVLVADDDRPVRELLRHEIARMGHDAVAAANGREALEIAQRESVDLVVTDINMPEMNGIQLLEQLKRGEQTREIPVIVISSQDDIESVVTCIKGGAEDHITKPYEPALLQARVHASLDRKRLRDLELDHLRRVAELTAAAEAVDGGVYLPGSLAGLAERRDELGRLARVFDRMVSAVKSREERLQFRLHQLRHEMRDTLSNVTGLSDVSANSPFASGEILAGRYEILGHLGEGGMGMVYRARDLELGEELAIKVVRRELLREDPSLVEWLKTEIRLARKISHRNVVRAHDLGEWKGTYFITMEYVKGLSVADLIDRRGRLTVESTLAIGTQLAEALSVAHGQAIVHRDIKPANLLVDEDGALKVMDFGLARVIHVAGNVSRGGFIVGTPQYMAPEQLMGGTLDARSDLFAVGVVLYECLCGRPPYVADSPAAQLAQIVDGSAVRVSEVIPDVPVRLESIVHQLLQLQPEDRVESARDLAHRLGEMEQG